MKTSDVLFRKNSFPGNLLSGLLALSLLILFSCGENKSSECELITLGFDEADNPGITRDFTVSVTSRSVSVAMTTECTITGLKAVFTASPGSVVKVGDILQTSGSTVNDFTSPVTFTVVAEDGTEADYQVSVTKVEFLPSVEPLIKSRWMTFTFPYNAYFPYNQSSNKTINGHEGNACGPTALAKIFHCIKYPVNGVGQIDYNETVPVALHWQCNLAALNLNYSNMPETLAKTDPESKYGDVAKLFLATASVGHFLTIWNRDVPSGLVPGLVQYFNLDPGLRLVNRWEVTRDEWIAILKRELSNGRPVMIAGRTTSSPSPWQSGSSQGHWYNVDGYNAQGEFHVLYNYDNFAGYYDADNLGGTYIAYNQAIVGFSKKK